MYHFIILLPPLSQVRLSLPPQESLRYAQHCELFNILAAGFAK
jgi:hypothetical protein